MRTAAACPTVRVMSVPEWVRRPSQGPRPSARFPPTPPRSSSSKSALVISSLLITVLSCIWVVTYATLGFWLSALIPFLYQVASLAGLAFFARTKRFGIYRASQVTMMLLLPFLLQWSLGGFVPSGAVALWAFTAPLGALVFYGPRGAIPWFAGFSPWWLSPPRSTTASPSTRTTFPPGSSSRSSR